MWTSDRHDLLVKQSIIFWLCGCQCIKHGKVDNLLVATSWLELIQKERKSKKWVDTTPMLPLAWSMVFLHLQVGVILCVTYPKKMGHYEKVRWELEEMWRKVSFSNAQFWISNPTHVSFKAPPRASPLVTIWFTWTTWFIGNQVIGEVLHLTNIST